MTIPVLRNGIVSREEVQKVAGETGRDAAAIAHDLLEHATRLAHPPVSNFRVGAVAIGTSGALYLGANFEIAGQQLCFTIHAEQSAVANAWMAGETGIERIVVTAIPCGHCRQFMNELTTADTLVIEVPGQTATLRQLLPSAFGPRDLQVATALMAERNEGLTIPEDDALAQAALAAANMSYAPYSSALGGVAVRTGSGEIVSGAYAENAAFNPSFPPLQVVLSQLNLRSLGARDIEEAVLVQVGSMHTRATELVLGAVSDVPLRIIETVKSSPAVRS